MARCNLQEAGAADALWHHAGGQARSTKPGLAQASRNSAAQGLGSRPAWDTEGRWCPGKSESRIWEVLVLMSGAAAAGDFPPPSAGGSGQSSLRIVSRAVQ